MRVAHSEFFMAVASTTANFESHTLNVNPGNKLLFPWLAPIAMRYEKYLFRSLVFHYHARCPTSLLGSVGACFDFDCLDPAPVSVLEAMATSDHVSMNCWMSDGLKVVIPPSQMPLYNRSGLPITGSDLKTYDMGNLHIYNEGVAGGNTTGYWEVDYVLDLLKPQIQDDVAGTMTSATVDKTHPFKDLAPQNNHTRVPYQVNSDGTMLSFLEPFEGILTVIANGTGLSNIAGGVGGGATMTTLVNVANAAATQMAHTFDIMAPAGGTWQPTVTGTTLTSIFLDLSRGDYNQFV